MQEMSAAQVDHYVAIIKTLGCTFYSCNKNQHSRRIAGPKGLVTGLHAHLAQHFNVLWDSHQKLNPLLRIYLRNRILRRNLSKLTFKLFEPVGEEGFHRFLYGPK
jgi:hypothetical protein